MRRRSRGIERVNEEVRPVVDLEALAVVPTSGQFWKRQICVSVRLMSPRRSCRAPRPPAGRQLLLADEMKRSMA
jgi:hypothetical protein